MSYIHILTQTNKKESLRSSSYHMEPDECFFNPRLMSKLREYLLFLMIIRSEALSDIASSAKHSLRQPTLVLALLDFG